MESREGVVSLAADSTVKLMDVTLHCQVEHLLFLQIVLDLLDTGDQRKKQISLQFILLQMKYCSIF